MRAALAGIKVVEVAQWVGVPAAAAMLADWGAEVIKVEHPVRGDGLRGYISSLSAGLSQPSDINYLFELDNRNKKSIALDLRNPKGTEAMHRLLSTVDVFLSNLRPYELEKFSLDHQTLSQINPKLIFANLTGYGRRGPDANRPGFDWAAFWSRAGIMQMLCPPGGTPPGARPGIGDHTTSTSLAAAILLALFVRERTGVAQEVDVSLYHCGIWTLAQDIQSALTTGKDFQQQARDNTKNPLGNYYQTKDGRWLMLTMLQSDPYWSPFCAAIGLPALEDDSRFATFAARASNNRALIAILDEVFAARTLAEWSTILTAHDLIWAPVQNLVEVVNDPQAWANDYFLPLDHSRHGKINLIANPIHLAETPGTIRSEAPELGQDTEQVLLDAGYSWDEIIELKEAGATV